MPENKNVTVKNIFSIVLFQRRWDTMVSQKFGNISTEGPKIGTWPYDSHRYKRSKMLNTMVIYDWWHA